MQEQKEKLMQAPTKTQIEVAGQNYLHYAKEFVKVMDNPAISIQEKEAKLDIQQREWDSLRIMWATLSLAIRQNLGKDEEEVMRLDFLQTMVQAYMEGKDPTPPTDGEKYVAIARTKSGWACLVRMHDVGSAPAPYDMPCSDNFTIRAPDARSVVRKLHSEHHLIHPVWQYTSEGKWLKL